MFVTEQRSISHAQLLAELSRRERLPVLHSFSEGVHAGGLICYGPHWPEMVSIATRYIAKILREPRHFYLTWRAGTSISDHAGECRAYLRGQVR